MKEAPQSITQVFYPRLQVKDGAFPLLPMHASFRPTAPNMHEAAA